MNKDQRADFEAWAEGKAELHKMPSGEYSSPTTRFASEAYQAALASPEVQGLRDALWVATEHNALHFGESHNTVIQGRAAIDAAMEKQK